MPIQDVYAPTSTASTVDARTADNQVDFDLEPDDLLAFIDYHYVQSPAVRRQRLLLAVLGVVILASLPLMVMLGSKRSATEMLNASWPLVSAPVVFAICFPVFYRWGLKRTRQRLLDTGDRKGYFGPRHLSLEDYGIRETTIRGDTIRAWPSVKKVIVVGQYALFYTSATEAFVVPKRAFEESSDFEAFVNKAAHRARLRPLYH